MVDQTGEVALKQKYESLTREVVELSFPHALKRLQQVSQVIGSPSRSLDEVTLMYQYANNLAENCHTYLIADNTPPKVIVLDQNRIPKGLRDLGGMV